MVIVQFDYGTDLDETLTDMRDKVDMVKSQLPEDASDPTVMSIDIDSMPVTHGGTHGQRPGHAAVDRGG